MLKALLSQVVKTSIGEKGEVKDIQTVTAEKTDYTPLIAVSLIALVILFLVVSKK